MPLLPGSSRTIVGANVSRLVKEGYPQKQAVAIALREAGKARPRARATRRNMSTTMTRKTTTTYEPNAGHAIAGTIMGAVAGVVAGGVVAGYYLYRDVSKLSAEDKKAVLEWLSTHPQQEAAAIAAIQDPKLRAEVQEVVSDEKVAGYLFLGTVLGAGLLGYMVGK